MSLRKVPIRGFGEHMHGWGLLALRRLSCVPIPCGHLWRRGPSMPAVTAVTVVTASRIWVAAFTRRFSAVPAERLRLWAQTSVRLAPDASRVFAGGPRGAPFDGSHGSPSLRAALSLRLPLASKGRDRSPPLTPPCTGGSASLEEPTGFFATPPSGCTALAPRHAARAVRRLPQSRLHLRTTCGRSQSTAEKVNHR
jgi:hypothetical protein